MLIPPEYWKISYYSPTCHIKLTQEELAFIQSYFRDKTVDRAYLFGSYARDDADEDSGIDILVELGYTAHIGLKFVQMQLDLQEHLNKTIDLISARRVSERILPYINQDKHLIYERCTNRKKEEMS